MRVVVLTDEPNYGLGRVHRVVGNGYKVMVGFGGF